MKNNLQKKLTKTNIYSLAIGAIVGFSCFILPTDVFLPKAGPLGSIIGIAIGLLFVLNVAFCFSIMINHFPETGGAFNYAYNILGKRLGFVCGWALLITYISIIGVNIAAIPLIIRYFFPDLLTNIPIYVVTNWTVYFEEVCLMIIVSLFFGTINYIGVKTAGWTQSLLAFILIVSTLVLFFKSVTYESASVENLQPLFSKENGIFLSICAIIALSPNLFAGFDTIPQVSEEMTFSKKSTFNLMVLSLVSGSIIYICLMLAIAAPMSYQELLQIMQADQKAGGTSWGISYIISKTFSSSGSVFLFLAVSGAVLSGINGFFIASSRLLYAMAKRHMVPNILERIHDKYKTPFISVIFVTCIACIVPFAGRSAILWTVEMSALGTAIGYFFTCICAFYICHKLHKNHLIKVPICIGIIYSVACILLLLVPASPGFMSIEALCFLLVWVLLGMLFYKLRYSKFK